jgi:hypothetical protein
MRELLGIFSLKYSLLLEDFIQIIFLIFVKFRFYRKQYSNTFETYSFGASNSTCYVQRRAILSRLVNVCLKYYYLSHWDDCFIVYCSFRMRTS